MSLTASNTQVLNSTLLNTNQKESNPFNKLQAAIKTYEQELIQLGYQLVSGGLNYETPWDYWCHPDYINTVLELDTDSICNEEEPNNSYRISCSPCYRCDYC